MVGKKPAAGSKKVTLAKTANKDDLIDDLKGQLKTGAEAHAHEIETLQVEVKELREQLAAALQQSQTNASIVEQLAHLKAVMEPFIKCAKGEGTTIPQDWDNLKNL